MGLKECLEMEFNVEVSMMLYYRYNFAHGVTAKLRKDKSRQWIPARLEEVTEEMLDTLFANHHGLRLDLSFLD